MRWGNNNLTNWLGGGTYDRELAETHRLWDQCEHAWAKSPLAELDTVSTVLGIVEQATQPLSDRPSTPLLIAVAMATDDLLRAEAIHKIDPIWSLIETDPSVAVEFRKVLRRRRRWALEYERLIDIFGRQLADGYRTLLADLPESAFAYEEGEDSAFTVPLSSLLYKPRETIEALVLSAYDDEIFRCDLFHALRERLATNLLVASGFPPSTDPNDVSDRLVPPTRHKSGNATELVDLYLSGTPFETLLDTPVPFRVPESMRFEHCHVIGGTGHGKTQLLQKMIHADLLAAKEDGRSVVVIDSQGDLIQKLVRLDLFDPDIEHSLADRLVVIDPADVEFPPSLNLFDAPAGRLEGYSSADQERALNGLIELYETFFGALLGAELTQKQGVIFRYLARLMLAIPGATIHTLMQLMGDSRPFKEHMQKLDGSARYFFETEFSHPSFSATKKQILKRLWGVLSTPAFERMFAQRDRKLDLFEATNAGKIILINTAKDLLKTDGSALFGRFFIAMLSQAALERSMLSEWSRTPTFVYIDEAQEYFDDTIETILSQARKYRVGMTLAHQTLDQLTPRLRAAFLSNTSFKCVGGVSSKDARALAGELHTSSEYIEGMRKRRDRSEFAVWLKHLTPEALRMDVPLGHLERQPTLSEETYDSLIEHNRARYCGTRADVLDFSPVSPKQPIPTINRTPPIERVVADEPPLPAPTPGQRSSPRPAPEDRELGKGGPKHRYLQSLVKELAESQGFRATIEAPLVGGAGQVDILLERDGIRVAVEVSVSTPADHERENIRKCLVGDYERVALVLAKSRRIEAKYRTAVVEGLSETDRERLSILLPEDIPDFIAALAPPPDATSTIVKGYRVRVSHAALPPDEAKARRDQLARVVARSLWKSE